MSSVRTVRFDVLGSGEVDLLEMAAAILDAFAPGAQWSIAMDAYSHVETYTGEVTLWRGEVVAHHP